MKTYILGKTKWENTISNPELFMWTDTCSKYEFHTEQDLLEMGAVPEPDEEEKKCECERWATVMLNGTKCCIQCLKPIKHPTPPEIEPIEHVGFIKPIPEMHYEAALLHLERKLDELIDAFNNHLTKRGGE